jgi:predicted  nucleic acid-binding Zn-ribbon protein
MNKENLLDIISEIRGQTKKINEKLEDIEDYSAEAKYYIEELAHKISLLYDEISDIDCKINELEDSLKGV